MTRDEKAADFLKTEWGHCETGIGRYDTLIFQVRTWAISICAAVTAAAVTAKTPEIVLIAVAAPFFFLLIDAQNKVFQNVFIKRSQTIQQLLRGYVENGEIKKFSEKGNIGEMFRKQSIESRIDHFRNVKNCCLYSNIFPFYALLSIVSLSLFCIWFFVHPTL